MLRRIKLFGLLLACLLPLAAQAQLKYQEGIDYEVLANVIDDGKAPKIIEFFWYGCPHCYSVHEPFSQWIANDKPENIEVEKVAAIPSQRWAPAAQLYYTAKELNLNVDDDIFTEIHEKNNNRLLFDKKAIRDFFVEHYDVTKDDFDKAWGSFAVQQDMKRAQDLFRESGLQGVPTFIVNGKYKVDSGENLQYKFDLMRYLSTK